MKKSLSLKLRKSVSLRRSDSDTSLTNRGSGQFGPINRRTVSRNIDSPSKPPLQSPSSPFTPPLQSPSSSSRPSSVSSPSRHDSWQRAGSQDSSVNCSSRNSSTSTELRHCHANTVTFAILDISITFWSIKLFFFLEPREAFVERLMGGGLVRQNSTRFCSHTQFQTL